MALSLPGRNPIASVTIDVPVDFSALESVRRQVLDQAQDAGLSEAKSAELEMAVDEACTNIIEHSYAGSKPPHAPPGLQLRINRYRDRLEVEIFDGGIGFDFHKHKVLSPDQYVKRHRERGLGMYIITRFVDDCQYRRGTRTGNCLRLTKLLK